MVVAIDGEGEGVAGEGLDGEGAAEDGAGRAAAKGRAGREREAGAGLGGEAGPGEAIGGLIVAVVAKRGEEALSDGVPDDSGSGDAPRLLSVGSGVRTVAEPSRTVLMRQVRPASVET